jgi:hypothetical protein
VIESCEKQTFQPNFCLITLYCLTRLSSGLASGCAGSHWLGSMQIHTRPKAFFFLQHPCSSLTSKPNWNQRDMEKFRSYDFLLLLFLFSSHKPKYQNDQFVSILCIIFSSYHWSLWANPGVLGRNDKYFYYARNLMFLSLRKWRRKEYRNFSPLKTLLLRFLCYCKIVF